MSADLTASSEETEQCQFNPDITQLQAQLEQAQEEIAQLQCSLATSRHQVRLAEEARDCAVQRVTECGVELQRVKEELERHRRAAQQLKAWAHAYTENNGMNAPLESEMSGIVEYIHRNFVALSKALYNKTYADDLSQVRASLRQTIVELEVKLSRQAAHITELQTELKGLRK